MPVSISDMQVLIEASVKEALAGLKSAAAGRLDERHFCRMDKFGGKNWKEFSFQQQNSGGLKAAKTLTTTRFSRMTLIRTLSGAQLRFTAYWRQW